MNKQRNRNKCRALSTKLCYNMSCFQTLTAGYKNLLQHSFFWKITWWVKELKGIVTPKIIYFNKINQKAPTSLVDPWWAVEVESGVR